MFRPVRKHQAIRIKREPTRTPVWPTEEYGDSYPAEYAEELLEIAKEKVEDALQVAAFDCYLFRRKTVGRRCTCLEHLEAIEPNMDCPVCFGTGYVGGWDKEGCVVEVFDASYPNCEKERCVILTTTMPHKFMGSVLGNGYVLFKYKAPKALGVDALKIYSEGEVDCWIRYEGGSWLVLNEENVQALINGGNQSWEIKAELKTRDSYLTGIYLRLIIHEVTFKVETGQQTKGLTATEFSLPDLFDGVQAVIDPNIPGSLSVNDFFEIKGKKFRFKATDLTLYEPKGVMLGYEATVRPITDLEVMALVP